MIDHRLRVTVIPWQDRAFVRALDAVCGTIAAECLDIDSPTAAARAQRALRADGFPDAVVDYRRTVDDVLHGRAAWIVRRGGATSGTAV